MRKVTYVLIIVVLLFAIYGSFSLSLKDFQLKDVCPKVLTIPACYIVLTFFMLSLITHIFAVGRQSLLYYLFMATPFLLALSGTVTELSGKVVCPRTDGGTPMCYISLGICSALLILKFIDDKLLH